MLSSLDHTAHLYGYTPLLVSNTFPTYGKDTDPLKCLQVSYSKDTQNLTQALYDNDTNNSTKVANGNHTITTTLISDIPITTILISLYIAICTAKFFSVAYRYLLSTTNMMRFLIIALDIIMEYKPRKYNKPLRKQKQDFPHVSHQLKASLFHLWWHLEINVLGRARSCCADGDDLPLLCYLLTY